MRTLTHNEILSLNSLLKMEANALAVAKAVSTAVNDEKLQDLTDAGIASCEGRIRTIQQFLAENQIIQGGVQ